MEKLPPPPCASTCWKRPSGSRAAPKRSPGQWYEPATVGPAVVWFGDEGMKLVTYRGGSVSRVGVQLADGVHDAGFAGDMVSLIERWEEVRDSVTSHAAASPDVAGAVLLAPL